MIFYDEAWCREVWSLLNDLIPVLLDNMAGALERWLALGHRGVFASGLHEPGSSNRMDASSHRPVNGQENLFLPTFFWGVKGKEPA